MASSSIILIMKKGGYRQIKVDTAASTTENKYSNLII